MFKYFVTGKCHRDYTSHCFTMAKGEKCRVERDSRAVTRARGKPDLVQEQSQRFALVKSSSLSAAAEHRREQSREKTNCHHARIERYARTEFGLRMLTICIKKSPEHPEIF